MPVAVGFSFRRERNSSVAKSGEVDLFPDHPVEEDIDHSIIKSPRGLFASRRSMKCRVPEKIVELVAQSLSLLLVLSAQASPYP